MLSMIILNEVFFHATRLGLKAPEIVEDPAEQTITAVFRDGERLGLATVFFDGEVVVSLSSGKDKPSNFVSIDPGRTAASEAATRIQTFLATGE